MEIVIDSKFRGRKGYANGGYACALLAHQTSRPVAVSLRRPVPVERTLQVVAADSGPELRDGAEVLLISRPQVVSNELIDPIGFDEASSAAARLPKEFLDNHYFPSCYTCGPSRGAEDGLRLFPWWTSDSRAVATVWTPLATVVGADTFVPEEVVRVALDCPSGWAAFHEVDEEEEWVVLGTLQANILERLPIGQPLSVAGWPIRREGRKVFTKTAIWSEEGTLCAHADAIWITIDRPAIAID